MKLFIPLLFILTVASQAPAQTASVVFNQNRQVTLEGGSNFRDLGGYPTQDGKTVVWKKIYRSADVSKLTDHDLATLTDLRVATVCDLRGPGEIKNAPDHLTAAMHYYNFPAGSEKVPSGMSMMTLNADSLMRDLYTRTDYLKAKYAPLFEQLLKTPDSASLMYHCTAGKDRTGMATALILSALGVPREYIIADYEATNTFWKGTRERMAGIMKKAGMADENIKELLAADPTYMETFLQTIDQKYGSMDNFLTQEMGLTPEKRAQLKALYVN